MKKFLKSIYTAVVVILILLGSPGYATADKTADLRQKQNDIESLRNSLFVKISLTMEKRDQLKQKIEELKKEINNEKQQQQVDSYQKARYNSRIDFNLKLIQLLSGYVDGLDKKIVYFQNGNETLDYFSKQVQDDLLMMKTLKDLEIDKLITQINSVLNEYVSATSKPMFEVNGIRSQDIEKIWDDIIQTN